MRGSDLLDSTPRQIFLQELLGLARPRYLHLPLAVTADGRKLSKRLGSDPLAGRSPLHCLREALQFLGQDPPVARSLNALWKWAFESWQPAAIPRSAAPPANANAPG